MQADCIYLGLGGNLSGSRNAFVSALNELSRSLMFRKVSSLYLTEPQDYRDQEPFLNIVAAFELSDSIAPLGLLDLAMDIEKYLGRNREGAIPKGPRVLDIDVLLFGTLCWQDEKLTLPHPRMHERRFVLEPLLEIEPDLVSPRNQQPYMHALAAVKLQAIYSKTTLGYTSPSI